MLPPVDPLSAAAGKLAVASAAISPSVFLRMVSILLGRCIDVGTIRRPGRSVP
jgi:hypothetical protein